MKAEIRVQFDASERDTIHRALSLGHHHRLAAKSDSIFQPESDFLGDIWASRGPTSVNLNPFTRPEVELRERAGFSKADILHTLTEVERIKDEASEKEYVNHVEIAEKAIGLLCQAFTLLGEPAQSKPFRYSSEIETRFEDDHHEHD
jgi:hypothetical protein